MAADVKAGPCEISGGPCDATPTDLYQNPPGCGEGSRALCPNHARITKAVPMNRALLIAAPDMLDALKAQHEAIDGLFAQLILLTRVTGFGDEPFMPSESGQPWDAMKIGNAAIAKAEGK